MGVRYATARDRQGDASPGFLSEENLRDNLWRINWRSWGYKLCGVYMICPDNYWPTKIGISHNPTSRLIELQVGSWRTLSVQRFAYCQSHKDARAVEKKTHQSLVLDGKSLSGEWFDIRPKEAFDLIQFNAALLGIELSTEIPDDRIRAELSKALTKIDRRRIEAQPEPEISEDYD